MAEIEAAEAAEGSAEEEPVCKDAEEVVEEEERVEDDRGNAK